VADSFRGAAAEDFVFEPLAPEDAVKFFQSKGYKIGFDYRDVWQAEHQKAFTVAKAMTVDLLQDIRSVVDKAIADGIAFEDFRANLEPVLRARGWWGLQEMVDPLTGEKREVQLGSVRRLDIIYDTNLRTSLSEGRWQQVQRVKESRPYLRYEDPDPHPRPQHEAWSGTVVRADSDWAQNHWPPLDYNCKCFMDTLDEDELSERGLQVSEPVTSYSDYVNPRTGETSRVPDGVHPSFAYPPGRAGEAVAAQLNEKLAGADRDIAAAVEKMKPPRLDLDSTIAHGRAIADAMKMPGGTASDEEIAAWRNELHRKLREERGAGNVAPRLASSGQAADLVRQGASLYPESWVKKSNSEGRISTRLVRRRGWHRYHGNGSSEIRAGRLVTAVHEYGHRLQSVMPELDAYFQQLHRRRTEGEALISLRSLRRGYWPNEMTRKDKYADAYFGKEYGRHGALEVLPMSFQGVLIGSYGEHTPNGLIRDMLRKDPEIVHLTLGLLFSYAP
jgi:hypothetical protein